jgi:RNA polymerase sigma-70 factor (TIGR02960 family)
MPSCLQESLLGAWRGLASFEGRSSLRAWLYQITTNACLRLISRRPRRILSPDYGPPWRNTADLGNPVTGPIWLEPWQDDEPAGEPSDVDPATQYLRRESVELAFVAALQHLPGTRRAVLILRDVLQFSSVEVARILDITPTAVNSAMQRARKSVHQRVPEKTQQAELDAMGTAGSRELVDAFMRAWERADVAALVDLLAKDARFTMPPLPAWFLGQGISVPSSPIVCSPRRGGSFRSGRTAKPGFAGYQGDYVGDRYRLAGINVLSVSTGRIAWIASFLDPHVHHRFGLPAELRPGDFRTER